jgi:phosphoenolpyruvate carboxykinase (GTP)
MFETQSGVVVMKLSAWVDQVAELTKPDEIVWITGEKAQQDQITQLLIANKTFIPLNPKLRPNSYLSRTDPRDVARVEERTFICSENEIDAGPTNNWMAPKLMREKLTGLFKGSMRGRIMYVIPFSMGPIDSPLAKYGVEITDSPYVVSSMNIMTRISSEVVERINNGAQYVPAVHTVGSPLIDSAGNKAEDVPWPCNPDVYVVQFPETREIWSHGSGYGGNSLLGKKAMSLRIGSVQGKDEGWLAEHMLLIRVTSPEDKVYHLAAAFPSACGKTNLAMLRPTIPGWKVETIGDDIVWIKPNDQGQLVAINPEAGFFGVAPGTGESTNLTAIETVRSDTVFTNVALTADGDVWWEGMTDTAPDNLTDWQGNPWTPADGRLAAHPNSRFCVPLANCPQLVGDWELGEPVVLDAILFGGRRATNVPLVAQSRSWEHGVFIGATMASEQTAAAEGPIGKLRRDPFAMVPFAGYNMAQYWAHWLSIGKAADRSKLPKIFQVNWFRKGQDGSFLWPGFGENSRVIAWVIGKVSGEFVGKDSALGNVPAAGELNLSGLELEQHTVDELFEIDPVSWLAEISTIRDFFDSFGDQLPIELDAELTELEKRIQSVR